MPQLKEHALYFWHTHPRIRLICEILTSPILWRYFVFGSGKRRVRHFYYTSRNSKYQQERMETLSRISQTRRERALRERERSPGAEGSWWRKSRKMRERKRKRKSREQEQSILFAKLPGELRMKIWEEVLCETGSVHVYLADHRSPDDVLKVMSATCTRPEEHNLRLHDCVFSEDNENKKYTINLLMTCKRIYAEAVDLLYSNNTLLFNGTDHFQIFCRSILPYRLDKVKKITIPVHGDLYAYRYLARSVEPPLGWSSSYIFKLFANMKGLQEVCLTMNVGRYRTTDITTWRLSCDSDPDGLGVFDKAERYQATACRFYGYIAMEETVDIDRKFVYNTVDNVLIQGRWMSGELIRLR